MVGVRCADGVAQGAATSMGDAAVLIRRRERAGPGAGIVEAFQRCEGARKPRTSRIQLKVAPERLGPAPGAPGLSVRVRRLRGTALTAGW
jgi:2-polyprenyl-6-methoxyphenol hydroxylase-like FAD-dependent oxidoreductase